MMPVVTFLKKNTTSFAEVSALFSSIASRYDRANNVMSCGLHHGWKRFFVKQFPWSSLKSPVFYIDAGCGSADIGRLALRTAFQQKKTLIPFFVDPNEAMLAEGKKKVPDLSVQWLCERAENISLPDSHADLYSIAFSLRNTTDRIGVLKEVYRLLKKGGWFFCLEFSKPPSRFVSFFYHFYLQILPQLGRLATGEKKPYIYLKDSIQQFAQPQDIVQELATLGFHHTGYRYVCGGISAICWGMK